ncbi:MAG TPA: PD-(D/E)XK nuclease family protein, partial [Pseudomonadales bacterium]|nr:PD-(D/E)XK nuclease family protein [Pseudomonadales bacterium]
CEWRIVSSDGRLNIIDRVIWQPSGDAVVIDFKTSQPSADESKEAFIARETEQYRHQLHGYRQALASMGEHVAGAGLYFTALGHWEPLL